MADSIDTLILTALTRAAAAPAGIPLFASKLAAGMFPASAPGRTAARRAQETGLISLPRDGKPGGEIACASVKGLDRLLAEANPKPVLDDFVRVLESRESQVNELIAAAKEMTEQLAAMKRVVAAVMPKVTAGRIPSPNLPASFPEGRGEMAVAESILHRLESWALTASEDCPLPVLFRDLTCRATVGAFHDGLRELHAGGEIYLHPWTGPLYALPEPSLSLLVGHEVAYYASMRNEKGKMKREKWNSEIVS